jgi:hypothetical protein
MARRTGYLVGGILLILLLGLPGLVIGGSGLAATCSNSQFDQALLGVPSCSSTLAVAAFGFVLLVIGLTVGIVLLVKSKIPDPPAQTAPLHFPPPPPPTPSSMKVCLGCGTILPSPQPRFCPSCGKPVPG